MRFDIVPLNDAYSGLDRSLTPDDFLTDETKRHYDELLSVYFAYLDYMCSPNTVLQYDYGTFCTLRNYYKKFCEYRVSCEMIAFDDAPICDVFGFEVKLLGIDIVHEMAESLLNNVNHLSDDSIGCLNEFGLLNDTVNINSIADNMSSGHNIWKPCWVYKVLL